MKTSIITEFVKFQVLETMTQEQFLEKAEQMISGFLAKQPGFRNAELIKDLKENSWCFILRYDSIEQVNHIVEKLRESKEFEDFKKGLITGSLQVSFSSQLQTWE